MSDKFTSEEIKMRQAFGGAQDYFDVLGQFVTKHRLCDLIITADGFNSPLAAVYWFKPVKEYVTHNKAIVDLVAGLEDKQS